MLNKNDILNLVQKHLDVGIDPDVMELEVVGAWRDGECWKVSVMPDVWPKTTFPFFLKLAEIEEGIPEPVMLVPVMPES